MGRAEQRSDTREAPLDRLLSEALDEIAHLRRALESRTVVGQATGVVMKHFDVDAAQALDYLKRMSCTSNRKLTALAAEIAETRDVPILTDNSGAARVPTGRRDRPCR